MSKDGTADRSDKSPPQLPTEVDGLTVPEIVGHITSTTYQNRLTDEEKEILNRLLDRSRPSLD